MSNSTSASIMTLKDRAYWEGMGWWKDSEALADPPPPPPQYHHHHHPHHERSCSRVQKRMKERKWSTSHHHAGTHLIKLIIPTSYATTASSPAIAAAVDGITSRGCCLSSSSSNSAVCFTEADAGDEEEVKEDADADDINDGDGDHNRETIVTSLIPTAAPTATTTATATTANCFIHDITMVSSSLSLRLPLPQQPPTPYGSAFSTVITAGHTSTIEVGSIKSSHIRPANSSSCCALLCGGRSSCHKPRPPVAAPPEQSLYDGEQARQQQLLLLSSSASRMSVYSLCPRLGCCNGCSYRTVIKSPALSSLTSSMRRMHMGASAPAAMVESCDQRRLRADSSHPKIMVRRRRRSRLSRKSRCSSRSSRRRRRRRRWRWRWRKQHYHPSPLAPNQPLFPLTPTATTASSSRPSSSYTAPDAVTAREATATTTMIKTQHLYHHYYGASFPCFDGHGRLWRDENRPGLMRRRRRRRKRKSSSSSSSEEEEEEESEYVGSGLYVRIRGSDMPMSLQLHAIQLTKEVLEKQGDTMSLMETARALKQEFDEKHGYVWHCIVGYSYGSYVTHTIASSIYFSVGKLAILLFQTCVLHPSFHSSSSSSSP